ncbi:hypothetical protein E2K80_01600 [Rhodophyticola sp. CCM32]|nr:hypothetical protein E2K80_01600 [Rhodophyticola sp. CCM32]
MWSLETLGRVRLGRHFFMREFLYSEIGNIHRISNIPQNPDMAIETGRVLCETLLDPLVETFGVVSVRSGYRSPELNRFGNENGLNCARNDYNWARHIWDFVDHKGRKGACSSVVIPWFADQYAQGRDWRDLACWMRDHLCFHDIWFFPKLCAFNLGWRDDPAGRVFSYIAPKGELKDIADAPARYADFPAFRGLAFPAPPDRFACPDHPMERP